MRLVGDNSLVVEGVMQDMLPFLVPKREPGHSEISKEEEQLEAYTCSYSIVFREGDIQFKQEELVRPVKTDDTTDIRWQVGNSTLIVEGVMKDMLAYIVHK